jgi:hypothetical protein
MIIQDFMGNTTSVFGTMSFNLWAILTTWVHIGVPQKIQVKCITTHFEQKFTMGSCGIRI